MEMSIDEAIIRYKNNAEYERTHGNLQGCLEFRQLAEWLRKYQQLEDFAKWVAAEVIDEEMWTYNYLSFTELACRKLVQLGIMQESDGEYSYEVVEDGEKMREAIETLEQEPSECKEYLDKQGFLDKLRYMGYMDDKDEEAEIEDVANRFTVKPVKFHITEVKKHQSDFSDLDECKAEDCINRKEYLEKCKSYCDVNCGYLPSQRQFMCKACMMGDAIEFAEDAPSVYPKSDNQAIIDWNNCHTEEQLKQYECKAEDCISREAVKEILPKMAFTSSEKYIQALSKVELLPSVYSKSDNPCDNCALNDGECIKKDICPKGVCAYTPSYPKSDRSVLEDIKSDISELNDYGAIFGESLVRYRDVVEVIDKHIAEKPTIPSDKEISGGLIGFCKKIVEEQTGENTNGSN